MKRLITSLLWIAILALLICFAYQKYTGRSLIQFSSSGTSVLNYISGSIASGFQTSGVVEQNPIEDEQDVVSARIKTDVQFNQEFSQSLLNSTFSLTKDSGKGDIYVSWSGDADHFSDQIIISLSGQTTSIPAFYNSDNVFLWSGATSGTAYGASGIIVIRTDEYYVYYPAINQQGQLKGAIISAQSNRLLVKDNLIPLLFYKDQYLFTIQTGNNSYEGIYTIQSGQLINKGNRALGGIAIEKNILSLYDTSAYQIILLRLPELSFIQSITPKTQNINYLGFTTDTGTIRIKYNNNLKGTTVYEKFFLSK